MHHFDLFYALFHALFYVKKPTVSCTRLVSKKWTPYRTDTPSVSPHRPATLITKVATRFRSVHDLNNFNIDVFSLQFKIPDFQNPKTCKVGLYGRCKRAVNCQIDRCPSSEETGQLYIPKVDRWPDDGCSRSDQRDSDLAYLVTWWCITIGDYCLITEAFWRLFIENTER